MDEFYNKHYILTDDQSRITDGWSDGPHPNRDTAGAICVNEKGEYQFRISFCSGYSYPDGKEITVESAENPSLYTLDGIPLYKWDGEVAIWRTEEEIEADRAAMPAPEETPTQLDRVEAQVTYTAMMTDTLLEV